MRRSVAVLALVLMAAAGCGQKDAGSEIASANGKKDASTASKKDADKGDPEKFAKCLRENGIDVQFSTDGKEGGGLVKIEADKGSTGVARAGDPKKFEEAHEKCKKYAPVGDGAAQLSEADKKKMLEHARCMRKEGIDMPDPTFDGKGAIEMRIPKDEKKFEAALKKCGGMDGGAVRIGGGGK